MGARKKLKKLRKAVRSRDAEIKRLQMVEYAAIALAASRNAVDITSLADRGWSSCVTAHAAAENVLKLAVGFAPSKLECLSRKS